MPSHADGDGVAETGPASVQQRLVAELTALRDSAAGQGLGRIAALLEETARAVLLQPRC